MTYETIEASVTDDILTITLNRPEVHNALSKELLNEVASCIGSYNSDKNIRALVLTGNGQSFCAGADLNWIKGMAKQTMEENYQDSKLLVNLFDTIRSPCRTTFSAT